MKEANLVRLFVLRELNYKLHYVLKVGKVAAHLQLKHSMLYLCGYYLHLVIVVAKEYFVEPRDVCVLLNEK